VYLSLLYIDVAIILAHWKLIPYRKSDNQKSRRWVKGYFTKCKTKLLSRRKRGKWFILQIESDGYPSNETWKARLVIGNSKSRLCDSCRQRMVVMYSLTMNVTNDMDSKKGRHYLLPTLADQMENTKS